MAEFLVRFVFETVLIGLLSLVASAGHAVSRLLVPALSGGRVLVIPAPDNRMVIRRWHGLHHLTDGTPVMGRVLASTLGLLILAALLFVALLAIKAV